MTAPLVLAVPPRLDAPGVRALSAAFEAASRASVVVLVGKQPGAFCLGMDFRDAVRGDARPNLTRFAALLHAIAHCPRPTLAIVDGPALGGGLGLVAACDMVIASDRARVGLPEALYGLAPAMIRPVLAARLSPGHLRLLLATCHSRDAHDARRLGLVDEIVPVDALAAAQRTAVRSLARARTKTIVAMRQWDAATLSRSLAVGVDETTAALEDPEVRAALAEEELPWRT